jgi:hypothetical protein
VTNFLQPTTATTKRSSPTLPQLQPPLLAVMVLTPMPSSRVMVLLLHKTRMATRRSRSLPQCPLMTQMATPFRAATVRRWRAGARSSSRRRKSIKRSSRRTTTTKTDDARMFVGFCTLQCVWSIGPSSEKDLRASNGVLRLDSLDFFLDVSCKPAEHTDE